MRERTGCFIVGDIRTLLVTIQTLHLQLFIFLPELRLTFVLLLGSGYVQLTVLEVVTV